LNDLLKNHEKIDFLKIDIEGAETDVLADCGNSLQRVQNLFVEYHSFPGKLQKLDLLLGILKNQGFRIQINSPFRYKKPFAKKYLHPFPEMDLQLNIFAFRDQAG
jgi:hypothetical protein